MKKVLLLSAPIGSGHTMAAEALKQELEQRDQLEVVHVSLFDLLPAWLGDTFLSWYLRILKACPWLYGLAYSSGDSSGGSFLWLRNWFNGYLLQRAAGLLEDFKPDIVIATHATPLGFMSLYKKQHPELRLYAVVPDYNIHHWWSYDEVDAYFIADKRLRDRLPLAANVLALGLPLRKEFASCKRSECRREHNIGSNEKVLLLMGGGDGLLPMEKVLAALTKEKLPHLRIIAIAGSNGALVDKLQRLYAAHPEVDIYGFRDDVPELLCAADIIVTKAGAVTAAEVLASNLSYIIYKPLPGQEEGNAAFLVQQHGARIARRVEDIVKYVKQPPQLVQDEDLTREQRKLAAARICDEILEQKK